MIWTDGIDWKYLSHHSTNNESNLEQQWSRVDAPISPQWSRQYEQSKLTLIHLYCLSGRRWMMVFGMKTPDVLVTSEDSGSTGVPRVREVTFCRATRVDANGTACVPETVMLLLWRNHNLLVYHCSPASDRTDNKSHKSLLTKLESRDRH